MIYSWPHLSYYLPQLMFKKGYLTIKYKKNLQSVVRNKTKLYELRKIRFVAYRSLSFLNL